MKGILSSITDFFTDKQITGIMNIRLFVITIVILLIALGICMLISKRNRLYFRKKENKKDNAYS
jgi:preprotein translocase subunit SecG